MIFCSVTEAIAATKRLRRLSPFRVRQAIATQGLTYLTGTLEELRIDMQHGEGPSGMTMIQEPARLRERALSPEEAKLWRERWRQAAQMDRQLRAARIRAIDWQRDWPWIDGLLRVGVRFAKPALPVSLIEYRRRLAERHRP